MTIELHAVIAASTDHSEQGISNATDGLVPVVAGNIVADITSPIGKLSIYSLAMIITQPTCENIACNDDTIRRLNGREMNFLSIKRM